MLTRARIPWNTNQLPSDGCAFQRTNDLHKDPSLCGAALVRGWAWGRGLALHEKFKELLHFSPYLPLPSPGTSTVQAAWPHQPALFKVWWPSAVLVERQQEAPIWSIPMGLLHPNCTSSASKCPVSKTSSCPGSSAECPCLCSYRLSRAFWQEHINTNPREKMP